LAYVEYIASSSSSSSSSFDGEQFKVSQRQSWDSAALGWKEWWQTLEVAAQKVSDKLIELAEIKPGQKVLDIATGIGEPAVTAARKLVGLSGSINKINDNENNTGHVLATDISILTAPRVEYNLTNKGQELVESIINLLQWLRKWSSMTKQKSLH
jgi:cyclopropane fatty-acyl-phospholipid synthase-like methyltransferase